MRVILTVLLLAIAIAMMPGAADGRSVKAYFNGQEATVSNITLNVGEPFTVDLQVVPDDDADVWAEISEPGEPRAYRRISGDELTPEAFKLCNASIGASFHWEMAAGGNWTGGTAPLNAYYQINKRNSNDIITRGYFTIVEAYIPTVAASTVQASENANKTPGPDLMTGLACIFTGMLIRRARSSI